MAYAVDLIRRVGISLLRLKLSEENYSLSLALSFLATFSLLLFAFFFLKNASQSLRLPPAVPGIPILGNLLQLREKMPHRTFTAWVESFGPIFTIKLGLTTMVVLSSGQVVKEALVTKYSSISSRKMSTALSILTKNKTMVAMSDYGEEYRMLKKLLVTNLLGQNPQRENRVLRQNASRKMINDMYEDLKGQGLIGNLNLRDFIQKSLYPFSLYQVLGRDPDFIYVQDLHKNISRNEMFEILVLDPLKSVITVDWRDLFPFLKWIPNPWMVGKVKEVERKRTTVMSAIIDEQRRLLLEGKMAVSSSPCEAVRSTIVSMGATFRCVSSLGPRNLIQATYAQCSLDVGCKGSFKNMSFKPPHLKPNCFLDLLITQAKNLTEKQLLMSTWESIIESTDTTLSLIEWIMYELAKNPSTQEQLYAEIKGVCGNTLMVEDQIPKLPILNAVIKETLRKYPPVALLPPRYVQENTQIGGYDICKGWQIIVNVYGVNYDKKVWSSPEEWDISRVIGNESLDLGVKDYRILPFGGGKRLCAGMNQVMLITSTFVSHLVQHFEWRLSHDEAKKLVVDTKYLTTHKLHPLIAIATPRTLKQLDLL